ncbi:lycopene beta-cyclase CrtY [Plastorhodobacter daqingensis]|uniref:Lycopene beta-cyclase CrtY n=1 Tax=Plastorhodobacter daqingensis TaxID=1387281 RepID=A0ABW2UK70_9RHOB
MTSDLLLAGAGLANSLIALAVAEARPSARILLLDRAPGPSDLHTWSHHLTDLSADWLRRLAPARRATWPDQEVRFPDHARRLRAGYAALDGTGLARLLCDRGIEIRWNARITALDATGATLADGTRLGAACVVDGRGGRPSPHLVTGFQKFLGLELETPAPHGIARPCIMDATVSQQDGYRFIYLLPFSATRLLIEDTRYSDGPDLDEAALVAEVLRYADAKGWQGAREIRRERGILPIALAHDARAFWADHATGAVPVGLRAGLFHPVTGYSLPVAADVADVVADVAARAPALTTDTLRRAVQAHAIARADRDRFLRLLSRMMFRGCAPDQRRRLLSRFYRLPEGLIERFYAGRLTWPDRLRIVTGKPPIPIRTALACLPESPLLQEKS